LIKTLSIAIFFLFFSAGISSEDRMPQYDYVKTLKNLKSCRVGGSILDKEAEDINKWAKVIEKTETERALKYAQDIFFSTRINRVQNSSCYYRVNYTSLFAETLYKLGDYKSALELYRKALTYRGLDIKYRKYVERGISKSEKKIRNKPFKYNDTIGTSPPTNTKPVSNDDNSENLTRTINELKFSIERLKLENDGLINQIEHNNKKFRSLEYKNKEQSNSIKELKEKYRILLDKQGRDISGKNDSPDPTIFFTLILGFSIIIILLIFYSYRGKEFSSQIDDNEKESISNYARKK
jgi:tetratricopeptide (TPR) repeat protein